ncbi:tetratricopeptide repeat protein [Sorangium cellulosum]|uniref:MalT-like TPR region domain-containing protein n=1 Tax=Sorangium cellulosum So0157-2 TaxID=1254432 RepID=S4Y3H1_SORCE|nr:tetratricopeptide repeat protein [Sorangium cellulosum]AGP38765.1 hypothetical protein SCE1572_32340 [Sorangium cellulosum So0157-2]
MDAASEEQWDRLREQIELAGSFWLGFVFSAAPQTVASMRQRAEAMLEREGKRLHLVAPPEPSGLRSLLPWLLTSPDLVQAGCIWIEAIRSDSPGAAERPWMRAWESLFLRTNEHRDTLRARLQGGLVFAAPPEIKPLVREAAPDLWSVNSLVIDLVTPPKIPLARLRSHTMSGKALEPPIADEYVSRARTAVSPAVDANFAMEEAKRRGARRPGALAALQREGTLSSQASRSRPAPVERPRRGGRAQVSEGQALLQAAEGFLAEGRLTAAWANAKRAHGILQGEDVLGETRALWILAVAEHATGKRDDALEHVERAILERRAVAPEEVPIEWIDLAARLSLSRGDFEHAKQVYADAKSSYHGRLRAKETVRGLSDLFVVLMGTGDVCREAGDLAGAATALDGAVARARRLRDLLEDSPESLSDLCVALTKLGEVRCDRGDFSGATATFEEALALARRLEGLGGEPLEVLRQRSILLVRIGRVGQETGDLARAKAAFEEALALRRRVLARGESARALRDVASVLDRLGELELRLGQTTSATARFEQAVALDRRRRELLGETPEVLRDLAISLYRAGEARRAAGDLRAALAALEESVVLGEQLVSLPEEAASSRPLLDAAVRLRAEVQRALGVGAAATSS